MVGFIGVMVVLVVVGGLGWWFSPAERVKRKLRSRMATPIRTLRPGEVVKVTGTLQVHEAVHAPFSDEPCAWWLAEIEERAGKSWRTLTTRWGGNGFWIDDGEERVWVDPGDQRLTLPDSTVGETGTFDDPTPEERRALERFGVEPSSLFGFNRQLRFREARLEHGELVSAIGRVEIVERDGQPTLALVPTEEGLVVSDAPGVHG